MLFSIKKHKLKLKYFKQIIWTFIILKKFVLSTNYKWLINSYTKKKLWTILKSPKCHKIARHQIFNINSRFNVVIYLKILSLSPSRFLNLTKFYVFLIKCFSTNLKPLTQFRIRLPLHFKITYRADHTYINLFMLVCTKLHLSHIFVYCFLGRLTNDVFANNGVYCVRTKNAGFVTTPYWPGYNRGARQTTMCCWLTQVINKSFY